MYGVHLETLAEGLVPWPSSRGLENFIYVECREAIDIRDSPSRGGVIANEFWELTFALDLQGREAASPAPMTLPVMGVGTRSTR